MNHNSKGFTLIEMLVVIAIISILVALIVPTVSISIVKAEAATDAVNLRSILAILNAEVVNGEKTVEQIIANAKHPVSQMDPDAVLNVVYDEPGFIDVYYVNGNVYYGLNYLAEMAANGSSTVSTSAPSIEGTWYIAGEGEVIP